MSVSTNGLSITLPPPPRHRCTGTAVTRWAGSSCSPTSRRWRRCVWPVSPQCTCCWRWAWTRWGRITSTTSSVSQHHLALHRLQTYLVGLAVVWRTRENGLHSFPWEMLISQVTHLNRRRGGVMLVFYCMPTWNYEDTKWALDKKYFSMLHANAFIRE